MRKICCCLFSLWVGITLLSNATEAQEASPTSLNVLLIAQSGYDAEDLKMLAHMFTELTGIDVNLETANYTDVLTKITDPAATYDVYALDQIWLADLVVSGRLTPLDDYLKRDAYSSQKMRRDIVAPIKDAFRYQQKLWAVPYLLNFQMLYYNQKMLQQAGYKNPPATLDALLDQLRAIKAQGVAEYPWTDAWGAGEALVCDFIWLVGAYGGELFDEAGQPIFDQPAGVQALEFMRLLLQEQLVNPDSLTADDLSAKDDFLAGRAAFTSNWLFMQGLLDAPKISEVIGAARIAALPAAKSNTTAKTSTVSAFQGLGIAATSQNKEAAWKWLAFFTSPVVQRAFAFEMPMWSTVQVSPPVKLYDPQMDLKVAQLATAHHRPNVPQYAQVSAILQTALHAALTGKLEPAAALQQAKTQISEKK